jgi:hypothetical protein
MGNAFIALLFAVGSSAYVYAKVMRSTGGNLKTTAIATGFCGLVVFIVFLTAIDRFGPK